MQVIEYQCFSIDDRQFEPSSWYDGDNVIADINPATGVAVRSYVTPTLDGNISMTDIGGASYYYNSDERQSVKNLTDSTGAVVQSYDYTAYGDKLDSLTSGSVEQRYTYTGRELNDVSGDYYFRYRMYGAGIGGFLSRDPLGFVDGMSMYAGWFARILLIDPMGEKIEGPDKIVALDKTYPVGNFAMYTSSDVCEWSTKGMIEINLSTDQAASVYPTNESKSENDSEITATKEDGTTETKKA